MKTEFLKQFYKDLNKITLKSTLSDILSSVKMLKQLQHCQILKI